MPQVMTAVLLATTVLLVSVTGWAEQTTLHEEETNTTFQIRKSFGGTPHVLIGAGAREVTAFKVNVYGGGLYVGIKRASIAWHSYLTGRFAKAGLVPNGQPDFSKINRHATARHFIVYGRFPKAIEMIFVRDAPPEKIVEAYEDNWERLSVDREKAGTALTEFMSAVNTRVQKGQHMVVRTTGQTIWVQTPAGGTTKIKGNRTFVTALWQVYFGNPCPQPGLRDDMLAGLDRLHKLATAE